ncbi:hypothetical protein [Streptomyces tubercidicus]|uniref:hypothetical protein n=1 Tax=Streptomyces tubercidicus TaxID=47759 RepID=UPI0034653104
MIENAVEKARKAAEAAAAKLAEAEAAEHARLAQIAAERAERARDYDRDFLAHWTEIAREAVESEGDKSADYDPSTMGFLEGLIRFVAGREKRRTVLTHAQNAESALGISTAQSTVPEARHYSLDVVGYLTKIVEDEAARRHGEFADALEAKRNRAIDGEGH